MTTVIATLSNLFLAIIAVFSPNLCQQPLTPASLLKRADHLCQVMAHQLCHCTKSLACPCCIDGCDHCRHQHPLQQYRVSQVSHSAKCHPQISTDAIHIWHCRHQSSWLSCSVEEFQLHELQAEGHGPEPHVSATASAGTALPSFLCSFMKSFLFEVFIPICFTRKLLIFGVAC